MKRELNKTIFVQNVFKTFQVIKKIYTFKYDFRMNIINDLLEFYEEKKKAECRSVFKTTTHSLSMIVNI